MYPKLDFILSIDNTLFSFTILMCTYNDNSNNGNDYLESENDSVHLHIDFIQRKGIVEDQIQIMVNYNSKFKW